MEQQPTSVDQSVTEIDRHFKPEVPQKFSKLAVSNILELFRIDGLEDSTGWKQLRDDLLSNNDDIIDAYVQVYTQTSTEKGYSAVYSAIANRILHLFSQRCPEFRQREVRFIANPSQGAPSDNECEEISCTRSILKPHCLAILLDDHQANLVEEIQGPVAEELSTASTSNGTVEMTLKEFQNQAQVMKRAIWRDCLLSIVFGNGFSDAQKAEYPEIGLSERPTSLTIPNTLKHDRDDDDDEGSGLSKRTCHGLRKITAGSNNLQMMQLQLPKARNWEGLTENDEGGHDAIQTSRYALEKPSSVSNRSHALGLSLGGFKTTLWYYGPRGAISRMEFGSKQDITLIANFVIGLSTMYITRLGLNSVLKPLECSAARSKAALPFENLSGFTFTCNDKIVTLGRHINRRFNSPGQWAQVHEATMQNEADPIFVKLSRQACTRRPDCETTKKNCEYGSSDQYLIIPGTCRLQRRLSGGCGALTQGPRTTSMYKGRELRVIDTEFLHPVTKLNGLIGAKHFVWCGLHTIHYLDKAGIHHKHLSPGNIAYRELPCGRHQMLMFDFGHTSKNDNQESSQHCTSTLPFLAIDLLDKTSAKYSARFDFESLLWISVWLIISYTDGKKRYCVKNHPLLAWFDWKRSLGSYASSKAHFLLQPTRYLEKAMDDFEPLIDYLKNGYWKRYFQDDSLKSAENETLSGCATFAALKDVLIKGSWYSLDNCSIANCSCPALEPE
ncbi:hypothetical protein FRC03_002596 [Tulasnella sp. 419]|nr:hypothetical protein FRC03_002596 [Tulasnella sp. 419]